MAQITLLFVRLWPIYDVIREQRYSAVSHVTESLTPRHTLSL